MKTGVSRSKGWKSSIGSFKAAGPAVLGALICTVCASTPKTRYYTLHVPPPGAANSRTRYVLQVEQFQAPDVLRDNRIIYYTSPSELSFHQYHRWSSDPAELLSELAIKYFAETGLFRQVYAYPAPVHADFTLVGRVFELCERKYEKGNGKSGEARLGLKLDLLQTQQDKVIWSSRLEQAVPVEGKRVRGEVDALNVAAGQLFHRAYEGIFQVVEQESEQKRK